MKYADGLRKPEAEALARKLMCEELKLRSLHDAPHVPVNYSKVEVVESFRRGYTLDDRNDTIRYAVIVTPVAPLL